MFQTIEIKNYRCFSDLRLDRLAPVNLIAGKNNTGKTALLEAILLHCNPSNCKVPLELNKDRGIDEPSNDSPATTSKTSLAGSSATRIPAT
jgi:predicted ATP-dependent endonuclease of OLD family